MRMIACCLVTNTYAVRQRGLRWAAVVDGGASTLGYQRVTVAVECGMKVKHGSWGSNRVDREQVATMDCARGHCYAAGHSPPRGCGRVVRAGSD